MKTITNIALSNDKKNKTRSILIIGAIILTTTLLTIISTFANGMIRSYRKKVLQILMGVIMECFSL